MSGVFQIDTPTGNVPLAEVQTLQANPQVAKLIPISMGDSFKGYRISGTTPDYLSHFAGVMASGALWQAPMQAVLGAKVARDTGFRYSRRSASTSERGQVVGRRREAGGSMGLPMGSPGVT